MLNIQFYPIKYNHTKGVNNPKYIVIHDTGNPNAGAMNHYKYFGGGDRRASAHYFVDNANIVQIIKDGDAAWHCGDGGGKFGITNRNSIGVEICLPGDFNKSTDKAVALTQHLMAKHNIPLERVVRHYDASRKICPRRMRDNDWALWKNFLNKLGGQKKDMANKNTEKQMYFVQVGAYRKRENANSMVERLKNSGFDAIVKTG